MYRFCMSINILHYNSYEKTKLCVDSCLKQVGNNIKIIIIDNCSSNDSLYRLKREFGSKKNVIFLEHKENYGFAKGNNLGIKFALGLGIQYTLLLNNDTELIGEYLLKEMIDIIKKYPNCAVVAPQIYDVTNKGLVLLENESIYLKMLRLLNVIPKNKMLSTELETLSEAQGSALLVNNNIFCMLKGFPEHYYMYGEESTFSKKILWNNYLIVWYKNQKNYVKHHHDKSGDIDNWRIYLMGRNRVIEFYENYSRRPLWIVAFIAFYLQCLLHYKKNYYYIKGMKNARKLNLKKGNWKQCYLDGYMARDKYRGRGK